VAEIKLTNSASIALVDDEDLPLVAQYQWRIHSDGYVVYQQPNRKVLWLHRVILRLSDDDPRISDHKDGNRLDNRKSNLRPATHAQNGINRGPNNAPKTSKFKGVSWYSRDSKWRAQLRRKNLGYFVDEIQAAKVYNEAALARFGEFAKLNPV